MAVRSFKPSIALAIFLLAFQFQAAAGRSPGTIFRQHLQGQLPIHNSCKTEYIDGRTYRYRTIIEEAIRDIPLVGMAGSEAIAKLPKLKPKRIISKDESLERLQIETPLKALFGKDMVSSDGALKEVEGT